MRKFILLSLFFLTFSKAFSEEVVKCDPDRLRFLVPNLSYYWTDRVNVGETLRLTCKRPFGVPVGGRRFDSSFLVKCEPDTKFSGIRQCEEQCDLSDVLKGGAQYDLAATINLASMEPISASKIVRQGDTIQIKCLPAHFIEELSIPGNEKTSFNYTCGSQDPIYKCKGKPVIFDIVPPKSNIVGDYRPKYNCNLNQLIVQNGKITAVESKNGRKIGGDEFLKAKNSRSDISSVLAIGGKAEVTCEGGFAAYDGMAPDNLGSKLVEKFKVTCDPEGSGKFIGARACLRKCDATALIKASSGKINGSVLQAASLYLPNNLNNTIGSLANKNESSMKNQYIDDGMVIKIKCANGYEVRSSMQDHYFSQCKSGVFSKVDVCEPELPPCENSQIDLNGSLLQPNENYNATNNSLTGTTKVGMQLDAKCQGGQPYFDNALPANNLGIPRCVYNEKTNTSGWNIKRFSCYNGCINAQHTVMKPVGKHTSIITTVKRVYSTAQQAVHIGGNSSNATTTAGFDIRNGGNWLKDLYNHETRNAPFPKIVDDVNVIDQLNFARREGGNFHSYTGSNFQIGVFNEYDISAYYCDSRQIELKEVKVIHKMLTYAVAYHKNHWDSRSAIEMNNTKTNPFDGDCTNTGWWSKSRGDKCTPLISREIGLDGKLGSEKVELSNNSNIPNFPTDSNIINKDFCNKILVRAIPAQKLVGNGLTGDIPGTTNVISKIQHGTETCRGWTQFASISGINSCKNNFFSDPISYQSLSCEYQNSSLKRNHRVVNKFFDIYVIGFE